MKKFIYFPSFSAGSGGNSAKKNYKLKDGTPWRFWSDEYPEKYRHKSFLVTAGHNYRKFDYSKQFEFQDDTIVMGDSGGYQISTGVIKWDVGIREQIFKWLENNSNVAINLDIPTRGVYAGKYQEALDISIDNFKYFEKHQTGKTDFLNVLQGGNYAKYSDWYRNVSGFDFQGWAVGAAPGNVVAFLGSLVVLVESGELLNPKNKWLHYLGMSSVVEFLILAQIQKSLEEIGSNVQLTTDSSTPSMSCSYGYYYHSFDLRDLVFRYAHLPRFDVLTNSMGKTMPILNEIDQRIWDTWTLEEFAKWGPEHYGWLINHNFALFKDCIDQCNNVVNNDPYIRNQFLSGEVIKMLDSIDEIVKSNNPRAIYDKYLPIYNSLNRKNVGALDTSKNDFF